MPLLKEKVYTIEDIYALPEGERAELIDGQIYYMSPPNTRHQRISSILSRKIGNYIDDNKGKCEVFAAPFAVYLDEKTNTYVERPMVVIIPQNQCIWMRKQILTWNRMFPLSVILINWMTEVVKELRTGSLRSFFLQAGVWTTTRSCLNTGLPV